MRRDYLIFILLLVFTTFEYFFRAEWLSILVYLIAGVLVVLDRQISVRKHLNKATLSFIFIFVAYYLVQTIFVENYQYTSFISRSVILMGIFFVATLVEQRAISIYIRVMYWIAILSLGIYALCLHPDIYEYLFNNMTPLFESMNVEDAVFEGGGKNIIIYNFQEANVLEEMNVRRNCGPFWEPGQFGVYLCIALFLNVFVEKQKNLRFANLIFLVALLTTFSTGAYLSVFFILAVYSILKSRNVFVMIINIAIIILAWQQVADFEFLEEKIVTQVEDAEVGSDFSRFGAFMTQLEMIKNSPYLGGELIADYVYEEKGTLASGTLMPLVDLGIPMGIVYYIYICLSCCGLASALKRRILVGVSLFILLAILSFSQTILMVPVVMTLMFVGLMRIRKTKNI